MGVRDEGLDRFEGCASCTYWVAVEELRLSYCIGETL